jgi:hypothetical protein
LSVCLCEAVRIFWAPWEQSPGIYSAPRGMSGILTRFPQPTKVLHREPLFQVYRMTASLEYTKTTSLPEWQLYLIKVISYSSCMLIKLTPVCLFRNNSRGLR